MFGSLDISASALVAHRTRLTVHSANMANRFSTDDADGNYAPYRRRIPVFAPGDPSSGSPLGVHVQDIELDQRPFRMVRDPGHPRADEDGWVKMPNIDPAMEQISAMEALRAYEANVVAAEATKSMMQTSLRLLA